jgi:probable F420-dependent oxidoreductase
MEGRRGFIFPIPGIDLPDQADHVRALVDLGYTDVWVGESDAHDAVTLMALVTAWEPRVRVGSAVVNVFTRPPGLLAMTAATLADAAPGRFVLGIGTSSPTVVEQWNAVAFDRPLARTEDVVRFLRRAFAGERIDDTFATFAIEGFRLGRVPASPPPIVIAALRRKMLALAGRVGDGVVLTCLSAADVAQVVPVVRAAAAAAGRPEPEVVAWVTVCPSPDAEAVRAMARRRLVGYLTVPSYAAFHADLGRGEALASMQAAWSAGDRRGAAAAIPAAVLDDLVVHGTPEECREQLARFRASGVTTLVLEALPGVVEPFGALEALGVR